MQAIFDSLNRTIDITEIFPHNSQFRKLLESSTIIVATNVSYDPVESYYKCLPFATVLKYFRQHQSSDIDKFMQPIQFDDDEEAYYDDSEYVGARLNTIEKVVGSIENFKQLILECFTNDEEKKDWWLGYWKIKK